MKELKHSELKYGMKVIVKTDFGDWFKDEMACVADDCTPSTLLSLKNYGTIWRGTFYPDTSKTRAWMLIQQITLSEV